MQVKKFEARTMKEALEMVKTQLGPDAIILSARDNNKSYGLVGQGSVEITAAISDESLKRRQFAENRMPANAREQFSKSPARMQKSIIEQFVQNHSQNLSPKNNTTNSATTTKRYADIIDDESAHESAAQIRIKEAAQRAWETMNDDVPSSGQNSADRNTTSRSTSAFASPFKALRNSLSFDKDETPTGEVTQLKEEIIHLKSMIQKFQAVATNQTLSAQQSTNTANPYGIKEDFKEIYERLLNENVQVEEAVDLVLGIQKSLPLHKHKNKNLIEGMVAKSLLEKSLVSNHTNENQFHYFVGPSGAGKTTTMVKMASLKSISEGKKVAFISTDIYKVGATDQLKTFAQILNVPFAIVRNLQDWYKLEPYFKDIDHVFVDTPGFSSKNPEEQSTVHSLINQHRASQSVHLVVNAWTRFEEMMSLYQKLSNIKIDDFIVNHLDQALSYGNIFSISQRTQKPIHSFGLGTRLPEDYEYATKERLLDLIFKITQNQQSKKEIGL